MKKRILFLLVFCISTLLSSAQVTFIQTTKNNVLSKKYITFTIVDKATNYVLAKKPVKYNATDKMPTCYFTVDLPSGISSLRYGSRRMFVIHTLQNKEQDLALENNKSEDDIFFNRARFIVNAYDKQWNIYVDNDTVLFRSKADGRYLSIDATGDYKAVKDMADASHWKLYRIY